LAKVNLKILNRRQPVARRDEQIVHNFINSTAASPIFILSNLQSDVAESSRHLCRIPPAV
jgi:hypothetical protein